LNPGLNDTLFNSLTALNQYVLFLDTSANIGWHTINAISAGLLFVTIEVYFFIRYIFSAFNLEPKKKQLQPSNTNVSTIDTKEYNAVEVMSNIGDKSNLTVDFEDSDSWVPPAPSIHCG